jgi:hypothetical protein
MSNTFYGRFFTERFPKESRVRTDLSSTGNKLFSAIGSFIERELRANIFQENLLNSQQINTLEGLRCFDLTNSSGYTREVLGNQVEDVKVGAYITAKSLKDFFGSQPVSYERVTNPTGSSKSVRIENLTTGKYVQPVVNIEDYIYINVKEINRTDKNSEKAFIRLHGYFNGIEKEEAIEITGEGFYKSKNKYTKLIHLTEDFENNISGGFPIEVDGLVDFKIDIADAPIKNFLENVEGRRNLNNIKRKRLIIKDFLSKPKGDNIIFEGAVSDNNLIVDLVVYDEKTYLYYYHNYFQNPTFYKAKELEENFFEELIGFVELRDSEDNNYSALDITYDARNKNLLILRSINQGLDGSKPVVERYEIGIKEVNKNIVFRTKEVSISIDSPEDFLLSGEEEVVRLITSNLDFPIKPFIVGKLENGEVKFLNQNKSNFIDSPEYHFPIGTAEDMQDSLETFNFKISMDENDIEIFTYSFDFNSENLAIIESITNNNGAADFNTLEELNKLTKANINSRIVSCSKIKPVQSFIDFENQNFEVKYFWLDSNSKSLYLFFEGNSLIQMQPKYYKYFYSESDSKLYGTEAIEFPVVFTLVNNNEVTINE